MPGGRFGERGPDWALVERIGGLGRRRRRILHEVGVRRHVAAVAVVAGTGRILGVVVVGGNRRLGRGRPQVGGAVVLSGAVLPGRHPSPGTPTILMERHDFKKNGN